MQVAAHVRSDLRDLLEGGVCVRAICQSPEIKCVVGIVCAHLQYAVRSGKSVSGDGLEVVVARNSCWSIISKRWKSGAVGVSQARYLVPPWARNSSNFP